MKSTITKAFNGALFLYICFATLSHFLLGPKPVRDSLWDELFGFSKTLSISLALVDFLVLILGGAALAKAFWNRWVTDVFHLRAITYDEALAIYLLMNLLALTVS